MRLKDNGGRKYPFSVHRNEGVHDRSFPCFARHSVYVSDIDDQETESVGRVLAYDNLNYVTPYPSAALQSYVWPGLET